MLRVFLIRYKETINHQLGTFQDIETAQRRARNYANPSPKDSVFIIEVRQNRIVRIR